jgi:predicted ATP-grasp superfamily ATP-dependent carboligase
MSFDALVLDASLRQSLVAVRSLGRRGLRVAAAGRHHKTPALSSRWCRQGVVLPPEDAPGPYLASLEAWLEHTGARVLLASSDATIALLRAARARLEPRVRLALASEHALAIAVDKERTLETARRLGIPAPRGVVVTELGGVPRALNTVGLPAVVKPSASWLWNGREGLRLGAKLVATPAEACDAVATVTRFGGAALIQQLLTGRREAVSFLYARGEVYARFAQWAMRTDPPLGGLSVLRQSIAVPPDIGPQAEALVREIDLEGYSEVEFRRGAAGASYLMEINPRLSASVEVAVRAGVDFPILLYQWASGGPIERVPRYRVGGWMRHLGGDIGTTLAAVRERGRPGVTSPIRALLDFGIAFLKPMAYDYFTWSDPLPAIRAATDFTRQAMNRFASRVRKDHS